MIERETKSDWGTGFYLLHGTKDGFYSTNDFSRSNPQLVDIAQSLLKTNHQSNYPAKPIPRSVTNDIRSSGPWQQDMLEQSDEIIAGINDHLATYTDMLRYVVKIRGDDIRKSTQTSQGSSILHNSQSATLELYLNSKDNPEIELTTTIGGVQEEDFNYDLIMDRLEEQLSLLQQFDNPRQAKNGNFPVVLTPDSTYSLIHEGIGHAVEADQIITGMSFLTGKLGYKVASSELTVTDDAHLRNSGWAEYDDEGTKTKGTLIIEEGILVDYLHTRKTAEAMDTLPTGNARASSFDQVPEPRQSNIFIEPKDYDLEEMLEDIDFGYLLGPTYLASTSIYTGQIQIETQYCQKIENGELTDYMQPATMNGHALNILSNVSKIGNTISKFPTDCLKAHSRLEIGAYAPHIFVKSVNLQ